MNVLVVDNVDSFTYMLVDYLHQVGAHCHVVRNNASMAQLTEKPVDGVLLSPGPGTPRQAGRLMDVLAYYYKRVPILGICLGHQAIGEFFGASLVMADKPMHGKVSRIQVETNDALFRRLPAQIAVTRYHSLVLQNLPETLVSTAVTAQQERMAIRHRTLPIWGLQFHPEATLTEFGLLILSNWINFLKFSSLEEEKSVSTGLLH